MVVQSMELSFIYFSINSFFCKLYLSPELFNLTFVSKIGMERELESISTTIFDSYY